MLGFCRAQGGVNALTFGGCLLNVGLWRGGDLHGGGRRYPSVAVLGKLCVLARSRTFTLKVSSARISEVERPFDERLKRKTGEHLVVEPAGQTIASVPALCVTMLLTFVG